METELLSRIKLTFSEKWKARSVLMTINAYNDTKMMKGGIWVTILKASCIISFKPRYNRATLDSISSAVAISELTSPRTVIQCLISVSKIMNLMDNRNHLGIYKRMKAGCRTSKELGL